MELSNESELLAIFRDEVEQRAASLIEGAEAMTDNQLDREQASTLYRDAHTIKGSSRVMGFAAMGEAARVLEMVWRDVTEGVVEPSAGLGRLLRAVAAEFIPALEHGATAEPAVLMSAVDALEGFLDAGPEPVPSTTPATPTPPARQPSAPRPAPPAPAPSPPSVSVPEVHGTDLIDLGGLLSTVEAGLVGPATRVETTKLYRLINRAAEVRLDATALANAVHALRLAAAGNPREVAALAARWESAVETLDGAVEDLQDRALELVSAPLSQITDTFPQFVRYLARRTGKQIRLELSGDEVEVDRQIVEHLREPLRYLIINAIDHGIESARERSEAGKPPTATVAIRASVVENRLCIIAEDDGRGIDWEAVVTAARDRGIIEPGAVPTGGDLSRLLFASGMTTSGTQTDLSGDGGGLAAVAEAVEMLSGGISIESTPGRGTTVSLTLPASWAMQDMVLLEAEDYTWGIPSAVVDATFALSAAEVRPGTDRMELIHQSQRLPISSFAAAVGLTEREAVNEVLVLATRVGRVAVTVPKVVGRRQVAVKGLGPVLAGVPHLTGAAVLGGGEVVVVVEPNRLGERVLSLPAPVVSRPRVLVVDDSAGARQLVASVLTGQGFQTLVAGDADEGLAKLQGERFDALVVDYAMPGSDGVQLVRTVRKLLPGLPIVMVSGVARPDDQARAWSAGVNAYLDKSDLRRGALASTLRSLLEMRESSREVHPEEEVTR